MKLFLVRHGNAEPGANDIVRPLSRQGVSEVKRVADFLKDHECHVEVIYHSIRVRARQTAEILHARLKVKKFLVEYPGLSPNDPVGPIVELVSQQKSDVMIVGHLPFLGSLVALLVSGEADRSLVAFPTGGVAILEKKNDGPWLISSMIDPKIL